MSAAIKAEGADSAARALRDFWFWANDVQRPPEGRWDTWLIMAGRGAGKTRAGAEFVAAMVWQGFARRIGLIGETLDDARNVMVEGPSGLMNVRWPKRRPRLEASRRRVVWGDRAEAMWFSADDPEQLRGPEFDLVWADEYAKWRKGPDTLDMARFALRQGSNTCMVITTTPRNTKPMHDLKAEPTLALTEGAIEANALFLGEGVVARLRAHYGDSQLARQELSGELLADDPAALFQRIWIDRARVNAAPELEQVVVAVDPAVTGTRRSDACGIVAAGRGADGHLYVLGDYTVQGVPHTAWAEKVARVAEAHGAARVVVETNQGGELVRKVLADACPALTVSPVFAQGSKRRRADFLQLPYETGRVHHVGALKALEDEMCVFGSALAPGRSPDRMDALVWALTALEKPSAGPRVRVV